MANSVYIVAYKNKDPPLAFPHFLDNILVYMFYLIIAGTLYFAFLKADDKLEATRDGKKVTLHCLAAFKNQEYTTVGIFQQLLPETNKEQAPNVGVQYPPFEVENGFKISTEPIRCFSGRWCKVPVFFTGR